MDGMEAAVRKRLAEKMEKQVLREVMKQQRKKLLWKLDQLSRGMISVQTAVDSLLDGPGGFDGVPAEPMVPAADVALLQKKRSELRLLSESFGRLRERFDDKYKWRDMFGDEESESEDEESEDSTCYPPEMINQ